MFNPNALPDGSDVLVTDVLGLKTRTFLFLEVLPEKDVLDVGVSGNT